jgi:hypothetical protein
MIKENAFFNYARKPNDTEKQNWTMTQKVFQEMVSLIESYHAKVSNNDLFGCISENKFSTIEHERFDFQYRTQNGEDQIIQFKDMHKIRFINTLTHSDFIIQTMGSSDELFPVVKSVSESWRWWDAKFVQYIVDHTILLDDNDDVVSVGIYQANIERSLQNNLLPMTFFGFFGLDDFSQPQPLLKIYGSVVFPLWSEFVK